MNWSAIGAIGEIVGATGVIISLVYLATQIRNQNQEAKISSARSVWESFREMTRSLEDSSTAELYLAAADNYENLTDIQKTQYIALAQRFMRVWEEAYYLNQQGRLDEHIWDAMDWQYARFLGTDGGRKFWELRKEGFSRDFQDYIGSVEPKEFTI